MGRISPEAHPAVLQPSHSKSMSAKSFPPNLKPVVAAVVFFGVGAVAPTPGAAGIAQAITAGDQTDSDGLHV